MRVCVFLVNLLLLEDMFSYIANIVTISYRQNDGIHVTNVLIYISKISIYSPQQVLYFYFKQKCQFIGE